MNTTNTFVRTAINNSMIDMPDYWQKCLAQRSSREGGKGSVYPLSTATIQEMLLESNWEEISHPAVKEPCRVFKTSQLAGMIGIFPIKNLRSGAAITLRDPKGTGKVEACVARIYLTNTSDNIGETYLIVGPASETDATPVVYTFHPGEPIRPSTIDAEVMDGKIVSVSSALAMGLEYAKVE